ncbi:hypothetical protein GCM10012275_25830 [Longimycelium tulufanense]|uniref:Uncharacterized protein n=1 Tax=Longimycelium tulufanense TaxID=907463 RepID=A0A8J3CEG0_9PSEU|nr:hypothetical protein [Longimycelium tulufanense]GGM53617.1 hypothetical protein GCM10012275_25830 [Longimycelium tulufanense]
MPWYLWHRIEIFEIVRGRRVLVYAKNIDDHGFYVQLKGNKNPAPAYAVALASEWLERNNRPAGRCLVVVWRLNEADRSKLSVLCEVPFHWNGAPAVPPEPEPVAAAANA